MDFISLESLMLAYRFHVKKPKYEATMHVNMFYWKILCNRSRDELLRRRNNQNAVIYTENP